MNDRKYCGDGNALIAFLYDDCEPDQRDQIAAHVAHCASCTAEIESLRLTRTRLAAWTPPMSALGFRVNPDPDTRNAATVLTSPRWWARPLPAWAQAAAAVVIFAGGVLLGARAPAGPRADSADAPAPAVAAVSQQDFDALRAEVARLRTAAAPIAPADDQAVLRRASALVDERVRTSEARLERKFVTEIADLADAVNVVRAGDLTRVQSSLSGFQRVVGAEVQANSEAVRYWNQAIRAGQVVPTSLVR